MRTEYVGLVVKTQDGVPIRAGMPLYDRTGACDIVRLVECERDVGGRLVIAVHSERGGMLDWWKSFSSREAAVAAPMLPKLEYATK